jgi:hypothetical protein
MRNRFINIALLLVLSLPALEATSQTVPTEVKNPEEVFVESWKKGSETIEEQQLKIVLSTQNNQYETEINGKQSKRYTLIFVHNSYSGLADLYEHWEVELHEILFDKRAKKSYLGSNLLRTSECGDNPLHPKNGLPEICDHVPKKDDVGVLYPEENAACYSEKNEPLYGNCYDFYYFKTVRKIKIENFCLIIKVGDYKFNEIDDSKLDKFEVFVEFTNACESK